MKILVSACLLGINCKYNGFNNYNIDVINYVKKHECLPICPEQLSGLTTPRACMEIINGKVFDEEGTDYTKKLNNGCNEVQKYIDMFKPNLAILKSKSPTCGYGKIYDGTFSKTVIQGNGVVASLIERNNIKIITEENLRNLERD